MKLASILKKFGTMALKSIPPAGTALEIIGTINSVLGPDQQLPPEATGSQALSILNGVLPEDKARVLEKEFDVELAEIQANVDITKALAEVDIKGSSTRPYIAKSFSNVISFTVILLISMTAVSIWTSNTDMIGAIKELWPLVLAMLTPLLVVIRSYFGMRSKEKAQKYEAVAGVATPTGLLAGLINKVIK